MDMAVVARYRALEATEGNRYRLAVALQELGTSLTELNRVEEAEAAYTEALETLLAIAKANPSFEAEDFGSDTRGVVFDLTDLYLASERADEAEAVFRKVLSAYRELVKSRPEVFRPEEAYALNDLGRFLRDVRRLAAAEQHLQEALTIQRELATRNPAQFLPQVAITLSDLAIVYKDGARHVEAEETLLKALEIGRQQLQQNSRDLLNHSNVAIALNNLGNLYIDMGRLEEAEPILSEALSVRREQDKLSRGRQRPNIVTNLASLTGLYIDLDRMLDAENSFQEAVSILRELSRSGIAQQRARLAQVILDFALDINTISSEEATAMIADAAMISRQLWRDDPGAYGDLLAQSLTKQAYLDQRDRPLACAKLTEALSVATDADLIVRIRSLLAPCAI
jgi:tetratricopeptide (TPR) repeat protein